MTATTAEIVLEVERSGDVERTRQQKRMTSLIFGPKSDAASPANANIVPKRPRIELTAEDRQSYLADIW